MAQQETDHVGRALPASVQTKHLQVRCHQRGIPESQLELVCQFGRKFHGPGGTVIFFFGRKALGWAAEELGESFDQLENTVLIFSSRGGCMTAYKRARPARHWRAA